MEKSLPPWLREQEHTCLPEARHNARKHDYLDKMLGGIQRIMAEELFMNSIAGSTGLLQQVRPGAKVAAVLMLLVSAGLSQSIGWLLCLHAVILVAAQASRIKLQEYLLRVWAPALVFSGIAVLPAVTGWVTPGETIAAASIGSVHLAITKQGVKSALFILLRSTISLGLVMLLVKTTRWPLLTGTLGRIGLPGVFVTVLDLTYRYLFLFLLLLSDYVLGRKSRIVGTEKASTKMLWVGSSIAGFLRLTADYGQEVAQAMTARGYTGAAVYAVPEKRLNLAVNIGFLSAVGMICFLLLGGLAFVNSAGL